MSNVCLDKTFGEMQYKHRWFKESILFLFGEKWKIKIAAKAYNGNPITNEQRNSYTKFRLDESQICDLVSESIKAYVNDAVDCNRLHIKVDDQNDLAKIVFPRTLLFDIDGTSILLFDCIWDQEMGIAVEFYPELKIGPQDLFL